MDKIFVGKVEVKEGQYGEFTTISFGPADLEKLKEHSNIKGWVNLTLKNKKDGGKYLEVFVPEKRPTSGITIEQVPF